MQKRMDKRFDIDWKKIGSAVKEFFIALGRGELLTRMRVDKLLPYILYLFFLGCISIWMSYKSEQTMLKVQQKKFRSGNRIHAPLLPSNIMCWSKIPIKQAEVW